MSTTVTTNKLPELKKRMITTVQINVGSLCNQSCNHCHVAASPTSKKIMTKTVMDQVIPVLQQATVTTLDITGGAPELNPHFAYLVEQARPLVQHIIVRCNLTVLFEPGQAYLPEFYKQHALELTCSLPCYLEKNVTKQRGAGSYQKSIQALKRLNNIGYGKPDSGLLLNLVYNPGGAHLPGNQQELEQAYKKVLLAEQGISFNQLFCLTNLPISRFKQTLQKTGDYEAYLKLLRDNYNPETLNHLMCLDQISIDYKGDIYDCDFNQVTKLPLEHQEKQLSLATMSSLNLQGSLIKTAEHCYGCTAGAGSSCGGALT